MKLKSLFLLQMLIIPLPFAWTVAAEVPSVPSDSQLSQSQRILVTPEKVSVLANGNDQLVLDPTLVTGNRELPRVMYIVPWKAPLPGDPSVQSFSSLLDEVLKPANPEVLQREVGYYKSLADQAALGVGSKSDIQPKTSSDKKK